MKGLLKFLSPFAPDQSGAVSALYGMDGLIVVCDAGGCTGNICGFDEPRWLQVQSDAKGAVFSAGLRDMDAILGRDERLVEKLKDAADHLDASFAALIGTPVPAVIATDFDALKQMAKERTGLPVLTVECTGTRMYDVGARDAWLQLFQTFAKQNEDHKRSPGDETQEKILGVIGCIPLDVSRLNAAGAFKAYAKEQGFSDVRCYGMGAGLEEVRRAGSVAKNLVISPAGLAAAAYLEGEFGTPYEVGYPLFAEEFQEHLRQKVGEINLKNKDFQGETFNGTRILIVHQQVAANAIRDLISGEDPDADVVCGTWFMRIPELAGPQDIIFEREEDFASFVSEEAFDIIIGDPKFRRLLRGWEGEYIECPHFAVSGILEEEGGTV